MSRNRAHGPLLSHFQRGLHVYHRSHGLSWSMRMFTTGFTDFQGACSARREWSVWASAAISDFKTIMLPVALLGILRAHPSKKGFFTPHNRPSRRCQIQMFRPHLYPGHHRTHTAVAGWRENELRSCPPRASDSEAAGCQQRILHTSRLWKMGSGGRKREREPGSPSVDCRACAGDSAQKC